MAIVAALFAVGVEASWISSTFSKYHFFSDVHLSPRWTGFSSPNPVLQASCYHCCRAQESCWFLCQGPDCAEVNAELALQLLFSLKTTLCHLCFLPAISANIAVCILYCILTVWDIFNKVVSASHSPCFGFELLQVLPFVFKRAAVEREVGKTQDHLSACSTRSGAAGFMLPWIELVSPALLQRLGTSVGQMQPLALYRPLHLPPGIFKVIFVICLYTHQKHNCARRTI